jgi:hypothetical protein
MSGIAAAMGLEGFVAWDRALEGFFRVGKASALAVLLFNVQSALWWTWIPRII